MYLSQAQVCYWMDVLWCMMYKDKECTYVLICSSTTEKEYIVTRQLPDMHLLLIGPNSKI